MVNIAQGDTIILSCTFVNHEGEAASISGTPTISISHVEGTSVTADVTDSNMTQDSSSTWYYIFSSDGESALGTYQITYTATYTDSSVVLGNETFHIIDKFYKRAGGGGVLMTGDGVWTEAEKDKLLKTVERLTTIIQAIIKTTKKIDMKKPVKPVDLKPLNTKIASFQKVVTDMSKAITKKNIELEDKIKSNTAKGQIALDSKININYEKLSSVEGNLGELASEIAVMSKAINIANQSASEIENLRVSLKEIEEKLSDIGKTLVLSAPTKALEDVLDGP